MDKTIIVPVYYMQIGSKKVIDKESMKEDFEAKLNELLSCQE